VSDNSISRDHDHAVLPSGDHPLEVTPAEFADTFGEELHQTLDVDTWSSGEDLALVNERLAAEVRDAVEHEQVFLKTIRAEIFPRLADYPGAPSGAGVYSATLSGLERVQRGLLFNGGVEACDGNRHIHDSLPLTVFQIGVSLVSYQGHHGIWSQRLFRRDLRVASGDPREEMLAILERRDRRGGLNQSDRRDRLSELAQRGIMAHAERAILLRRSAAPWRIGHGNPAPYELITGSGSLDLMIESTRIIREMVEEHQRFLFVASEPADRVLLTIGQALRPLEYAIVSTLKEQIDRVVSRGHYRGSATSDTTWDREKLTPTKWIETFRDVVAPQVVIGVFRATRLAPAQVFYAHVDHADIAAHIALADSVLQEHRGFPLLLDLAHSVCSGVFRADTLSGPIATAYVDAGAPWRYLSERDSRRS
jgi:hypothetical protein